MNVVASSEKLSHWVLIWPFSVQVAVSGLAPVPSGTYIRIAHTSSVAPAAKYTYHLPLMKWISGA